MDWLKYRDQTLNEIINTYYYGNKRNIEGMRYLKVFLGTAKKPTPLPQTIVDQLAGTDTALPMPSLNLPNPASPSMPKPKFKITFKWYQPVKHTILRHDKFNDVYVVYDVTDKHNPKFLTALTGLQKEQLGEKKFNEYIKYLKRAL